VFRTRSTEQHPDGPEASWADLTLGGGEATIFYSRTALPGSEGSCAGDRFGDRASTATAIRTGEFESIGNYLVTRREVGMVSFDESVLQLLKAGKITPEVAEQNVRDPSLLLR
jgi:hypothetical protein